MVTQLSNSQALEIQCRNKSLVDRKKALDIEKDRARRIAGLPAPQSHNIIMVSVRVKALVCHCNFVHIGSSFKERLDF